MKKRIFAALLTAVMVVCLLPFAAFAQTSGSVTPEDALWAQSAEQSELSLADQARYLEIWASLNSGVRTFAMGDADTPFLISNASQLKELAAYVNAGNTSFNAAHYQLVDNIALSDYAPGTTLGGTAGWTPIGTNSHTFKGVFDGQNYAVTGLEISNVSADYQGLFGYVSGVDSSHKAQVKNVTVQGAVVSGGNYIGAVVGYYGDFTDSLTGCAMLGGRVGATGNFLGGVVGHAGSVVASCYATGSVSGTGGWVGGVAGQTFDEVANCYATGTVSGGGDYVGGIAGVVVSASNCYATGSVSGASGVGGVVGAGMAVTSCVALGRAVSGTANVDRVAHIPAAGSYAWSGMTVQVGSDPSATRSSSNANSEDGADLTYDGTNLSTQFSSIFTGDVSAWNTLESNKLPALKNVGGTQSSVLPGWITKDPADTAIYIYTAADLKQLADEVNGVGQAADNKSGKTYKLASDIDLSAYQTGAGWTPIGAAFLTPFSGIFDGQNHTVRGLKIDNTTDFDPQGLFGYVNGVSGTNAQVRNIVVENAIVSGRGSVGAVVGWYGDQDGSYTEPLTGCAMVGGSVSGTNECVGGVVGYAPNCIVTNCYATGGVMGTSRCVGGVAGQVGSISNCYATGNVSGGAEVGGVVGYASSSATNCYATGNVSGTGMVGGVVGHIYSVEYCVSLGRTVSGTSSIGRVVGNATTTTGLYAWDGMLLKEGGSALEVVQSSSSRHGANLEYSAFLEAGNRLLPQFAGVFATNTTRGLSLLKSSPFLKTWAAHSQVNCRDGQWLSPPPTHIIFMMRRT